MPLFSLCHPLPPPSHHPSRDLHVTRPTIPPSVASLSRALVVSPAAILSRDSETRRYSSIVDLVGSSSDLRISSVTFGPSTFGFGHRIGSHRIYFGSSLDLSDSSSILEIGHSSEILRISRPFTHPVPFPLPFPLPFPPLLLGCLLIFVLTRPPPHFPIR